MKAFAENVSIFIVADNLVSPNLIQLNVGNQIKMTIFYHLNYICTHTWNSTYLHTSVSCAIFY